MDSTSLVMVVLTLAGLCGAAPSAAFLHDLLVQPLQFVQAPPYRRAAYDAPQYPGVASSVSAGSTGSRPMAWPAARPSSYDVGTGYSYSGSSSSNNNNNPFVAFLQNPWFPWANRQPLSPSGQPLQQQPLQQQTIWGFLPWNNNNNNNGVAGAQQTTSGPVLSFLQNPTGLLAWMQPGNRPGSSVIYTTPLAVSAAPAAPAAAAAPPALPASAASGQLVAESTLGAPAGSSIMMTEDMGSAASAASAPTRDMEGVRRIALDSLMPVPCADGDGVGK